MVWVAFQLSSNPGRDFLLTVIDVQTDTLVCKEVRTNSRHGSLFKFLRDRGSSATLRFLRIETRASIYRGHLCYPRSPFLENLSGELF